MLRRLLLLFCSACLVAGVGAAIGGGIGSAVNGCGTPTPSATPTPTPSGSPAPCDTTAPKCYISGITAGPPKQMQVTTQDTGSGIASISVGPVTNATVSVAPFTPGTTSPIVVTATKVNQTMTASWSFTVTDVAGNVKLCA